MALIAGALLKGNEIRSFGANDRECRVEPSDLQEFLRSRNSSTLTDPTRWWRHFETAIRDQSLVQLDSLLYDAEQCTDDAVERLFLSCEHLQVTLLDYYTKIDATSGITKRLLELVRRCYPQIRSKGDQIKIGYFGILLLQYSYRYSELPNYANLFDELKSISASRQVTEIPELQLRLQFTHHDYWHLTQTGMSALIGVETLREFAMESQLSDDACASSLHCSACTALRVSDHQLAGGFLELAERECRNNVYKWPEETLKKRLGYIQCLWGKFHFCRNELETAEIRLKSAICLFRDFRKSHSSSQLHLLACGYAAFLIARIEWRREQFADCAAWLKTFAGFVRNCAYTHCCLFDCDFDSLRREASKMALEACDRNDPDDNAQWLFTFGNCGP